MCQATGRSGELLAASFEARLSLGGRSSLRRSAAALLTHAFSRQKVADCIALFSAQSAPGACWASSCQEPALHLEEQLWSSSVSTASVLLLAPRSRRQELQRGDSSAWVEARFPSRFRQKFLTVGEELPVDPRAHSPAGSSAGSVPASRSNSF